MNSILLKLKVPSSWKEVSIKQFQELSEVESTGAQGAIERLSILCDCDPEDLRKTEIDTLNQLADKVRWTEALPSQDSYKKEFSLDGKRFHIINFEKVTLGEWVDLEQLVSDGAQKNLHKILAIVYREILYDEPEIELLSVKPYDVVESAKNSLLFQEELDVQTVYGSCLFFSLLGSRLATITALSLKAEMMTMMKI